MIEKPSELPENKTASATHWPNILQFVFSLLGILLAGSIAGMMLITGIIQLFAGFPMEATVILTYAATGLFVGALLLPPAILSLSRITGREIEWGPWQTIQRVLRPKRLILLLPVIILIGHWANHQESLSWFILPPIHIMAVSLPILWLVWLGIRQLEPFSSLRT
jgi:hypothetical protein